MRGGLAIYHPQAEQTGGGEGPGRGPQEPNQGADAPVTPAQPDDAEPPEEPQEPPLDRPAAVGAAALVGGDVAGADQPQPVEADGGVRSALPGNGDDPQDPAVQDEAAGDQARRDDRPGSTDGGARGVADDGGPAALPAPPPPGLDPRSALALLICAILLPLAACQIARCLAAFSASELGSPTSIKEIWSWGPFTGLNVSLALVAALVCLATCGLWSSFPDRNNPDERDRLRFNWARVLYSYFFFLMALFVSTFLVGLSWHNRLQPILSSEEIRGPSAEAEHAQALRNAIWERLLQRANEPKGQVVPAATAPPDPLIEVLHALKKTEERPRLLLIKQMESLMAEAAKKDEAAAKAIAPHLERLKSAVNAAEPSFAANRPVGAIRLFVALLMGVLGVLFFLIKSLSSREAAHGDGVQQARRRPEEFSSVKLWAGAFFRTGQAIAYTIIFLFLLSYADLNQVNLPILALFLGMFVTTGESLIFDFGKRTLDTVRMAIRGGAQPAQQGGSEPTN